jgi:oxygen-dependent protoporphyrinogen oxidase
VAFLGYRAADIAHPLDGLGVLMPRVERRSVLGMLFSSTLFEGRAPAEHVALTAYVGGARQPELAQLAPEAMTAMVHDEVRGVLGARGVPVFARVRYWRYGLPQPGLDHAQRVERLRALEEALPGIFITGNYLNGVSTAACIDAAFAVAQRVLDQPGRMPARPAGRLACRNSAVMVERPAA